jgi:hypothetical protein
MVAILEVIGSFAGFVLVVAGVAQLSGPPAAMIVAGALLLYAAAPTRAPGRRAE